MGLYCSIIEFNIVMMQLVLFITLLTIQRIFITIVSFSFSRLIKILSNPNHLEFNIVIIS